ncbi:ERF family protein [Clostridium sp. D2Q-14]|uniref:ERF family protein n=1 Tax=Anaeromonas gelatinilytica TaxID=2683194 RepID=UPI00193B12D5|nr:ERF family protein [Anaeromonas gelatinilytica]MBS4535966.1 ERF family protein [Anaeromonas gelatinilytica]
MNKSESIKNLAIALSKFQSEIKNPANTATNPFFKSKYAPLNDVLNLIRPILSKYGLSIMQAPAGDGEKIVVTTLLLHESGEWIEPDPLILKADKATAQGAGSAITYARRYALSAILGISSEDDDDGNNAEPKKKNASSNATTSNSNLSDKQIERLYAIAYSANIDADTVKEQVKKKFNKDVSELTKQEYDNVCKGYESLKK